MSTIHVITNRSNDRIVVYDTNCGEVVHEGTVITARDIFNILESVCGVYERVKFHEFTEEEMDNWIEHLYG